MSSLQSRKRRAEVTAEEGPESSPEPATRRRRRNSLQGDDNEDRYDSDAGSTQADDSQDNMAKKLVRLALACEYQRKPIRRADISEKVLGNAGRQFKTIFDLAQLQLRSVFGMEMFELPAKEKVTLAQKRAAKSQSQGSKPAPSYVLVSVLPSQYRDPKILPPPFAPTPVDDAKYVAVYTLLITLITLSGGSLPDAKMERYLRRIDMEDSTPVAGFQKTEQLLKRMEKDGYIIRVREPTGTGEDDVFWTVGPRGKVEVGDDGVRGLATTVYGERGEEADEDLEKRIARSLALGEKVAPRVQDQPEMKRRGRKKRNAEEDDDGNEGD